MPRKVATADRVDIAELTEFIRQRHNIVLSTVRADGRAQLSPVTAGVDPEGRLVIASYPKRAKVSNVRRNPNVTACVLSNDFNGPWVQIEGTAEVLDLPDALEPLVEYFRSISGEHPDWHEYRKAMQQQAKCLIRVIITDWGPIATGGFPKEVADRLD